jgi:putative membrane protein
VVPEQEAGAVLKDHLISPVNIIINTMEISKQPVTENLNQQSYLLPATFKKNDKQAKLLIGVFSFVVFAAVVILTRVKLAVDLGFDIHLFAAANAIINTIIAITLVAALVAVKNGNYLLHKKLMITALVLSILFLVSYIAHHLLAGEIKYGDANLDGMVDDAEKAALGGMRLVYLIILLSHIFLAAIILPFILFTAYRGLTGEYTMHKKLARITWPLWFYVAVTGPIVYLMIKPYYS